MTRTQAQPRDQLQLPDAIGTVSDVLRLQRELEKIADAILRLKVKSAESVAKAAVDMSPIFREVCAANKLDMTRAEHRRALSEWLDYLMADAPVAHISLAAEPSSSAVSQLVSWFRHNVHRYTLLRVAISREIVVGCVVRLGSKVYDMSLSQALHRAEPDLAAKLRELQA
jgi:hypothetical protein